MVQYDKFLSIRMKNVLLKLKIFTGFHIRIISF